MKAIVAIMLLQDLGSISANIWGLHTRYVTHFGSYASQLVPDPSELYPLFVSPAVAFGVQSFFAYRAWKVSRNWWLLAAEAVLILACLTSGYAIFAITIASKSIEWFIRWITIWAPVRYLFVAAE